MSEEYKVQVAGKEYTIAPPSLDKTMRITDYVAEVLEQVPGIFDEVESYKLEYKINHQEILTKEEAEDPNNAEILEALGVAVDDFEDKNKIITDEISGRTGIPFYKSPSDSEVLATVFPKVWRAARGHVVQLCSLLIITDGQLEEHDKRGAVSGLIEDRAHWLRHNASLDEILELLSVGIIIFKSQLETASKSLGKVTTSLTEMLSEAQTAESNPEQNQSSEPNEERK